MQTASQDSQSRHLFFILLGEQAVSPWLRCESMPGLGLHLIFSTCPHTKKDSMFKHVLSGAVRYSQEGLAMLAFIGAGAHRVCDATADAREISQKCIFTNRDNSKVPLWFSFCRRNRFPFKLLVQVQSADRYGLNHMCWTSRGAQPAQTHC